MRIAYIVHDINDAAVARRVQMLRAGGAAVIVAGFRRDPHGLADIDGAPVADLGRTTDLRLVDRAAKVLRHLLFPGRLARAVGHADVVIGRNLEALALASRIRRRAGASRLVYECLDIHRLLTGRSPFARAVQFAEARLLAGVDLLIVSSPAFLRIYFDGRKTLRAEQLVVENKLLGLHGPLPAVKPTPPGPPWTIGWFGNLRCRRSFALLAALARTQKGNVRILIAGRPTQQIFPDFEALVETAPHCTYVGRYQPADLSDLYGRCHFAWAVDYFEEGQNSAWLLPNRLYEASRFGAIPIALSNVETGKWLDARGTGLVIGDPLELDDFFDALTPAAFARLRNSLTSISDENLVTDTRQCLDLVRRIGA